jgi:hypothetical protein
MAGPPFPWDQVPEDNSGYIVVDPQVLAALRELLALDLVGKHYQPIMRLVLQVVRIDPTSGNLVINATLVRDVEADPPDNHLGTV